MLSTNSNIFLKNLTVFFSKGNVWYSKMEGRWKITTNELLCMLYFRNNKIVSTIFFLFRVILYSLWEICWLFIHLACYICCTTWNTEEFRHHNMPSWVHVLFFRISIENGWFNTNQERTKYTKFHVVPH